MRIKQLVDEDCIQYCKTSMFIGTANCDWKCDKLNGCQVCQNMPLATAPTIVVDNKALVERYMGNPFTEAIVFGGLEPFDQAIELLDCIAAFREQTNDDIVIYTGYDKGENGDITKYLTQFPNIIVKYGRYIMGQKSHFDIVLGVNLASNNQYAERIS